MGPNIAEICCKSAINIEGLWGRCGIRRAIHRHTGLGDWLILLAAHAGEGCDLGGSTGLLVKTSPGWREYQRY